VKETKNGAELAMFFLEVFRNPKARLDHRMQAGTWLADRCFGKPRQALDLGDGFISMSEWRAQMERASESLARHFGIDGSPPTTIYPGPADGHTTAIERLLGGDSDGHHA
jgi:hypothetical protein